MLTNDQMRSYRYGKWAESRKLIKKIQETLKANGLVIIATYTKATQYDKRHVDYFKATRNGAYVKSGKQWLCIDRCGFRFYTPISTWKTEAKDLDMMHEYRDF